ncbi:type I restriction enzyme HsdR N-terminal domain-containing protein [Bacteroidota bacterium]
MDSLNLPTYSFNIKSEGQRKLIFDKIRKRFVVLTPEEWVRQNFISFLIEEKKYPASLISVEMSIEVNRLKRRCDIVIFDRKGYPVLVVECKAPKVKITQSGFDQVAAYNIELQVNYLIVTNGLSFYCCSIDHKLKNYAFLKNIPEFEEIINTK